MSWGYNVEINHTWGYGSFLPTCCDTRILKWLFFLFPPLPPLCFPYLASRCKRHNEITFPYVPHRAGEQNASSSSITWPPSYITTREDECNQALRALNLLPNSRRPSSFGSPASAVLPHPHLLEMDGYGQTMIKQVVNTTSNRSGHLATRTWQGGSKDLCMGGSCRVCVRG